MVAITGAPPPGAALPEQTFRGEDGIDEHGVSSRSICKSTSASVHLRTVAARCLDSHRDRPRCLARFTRIGADRRQRAWRGARYDDEPG
jgi:hypothetical protein